MYYINTCINTINMILVLTCTCRYPSMCLFFISVHVISFFYNYMYILFHDNGRTLNMYNFSSDVIYHNRCQTNEI